MKILECAVGAPAFVIAVWALFIAPKRRIDLARPLRLVLEFVVFGGAALALAAAGERTLAVVFAVVAAISGTLNYIWDWRPLSSPRSVRLGP